MANIFQERYYKVNKILLLAIGQWPYLSRARRLLSLGAFVLLAISQMVPQIIAVVEFRHDRDVVVDSIPPFAIDLACAIKLTNIAVNVHKMLKIFERIKFDWKLLANQPELSVLREYAEDGRKFTLAYTVGIYFITVVFMTQPIVMKTLQILNPANDTEPVKYPFPVDYYGIDIDTYYFYLLIHSSVVVAVMLTVIIAADTMYVIQVQHGCAMFAVVGHQLRRMGDESPEYYQIYSRPADDPAFRHLAYCIKNHNHAIELSDLLESTYTCAFFSSVGFNMLVISVTGFQIVITIDKNPEEALRYILFAIAQLIHLFFQSFFAQRLMDHSLQVRDYLCQAEWYKTSLYTQKLLSLVSARCLVPCQLTAGKFLVMSLETFTSREVEEVKQDIGRFDEQFKCLFTFLCNFQRKYPLLAIASTEDSIAIIANWGSAKERYYRINKILLLVIGQWPYLSRATRLFALAAFLLLAISQMIPQIIAVVEFRHDRDIVVDSIPPFAIDLACGIKLTNIVVNLNKMLKIFERIKFDWKLLANQPELRVLQEYAENGRKFTIAYTVGIYFITVVFMTQPVVMKTLQILNPANDTEPVKYPFPVDYYGIDIDTYYFYLLVHSSIVVAAILTVIVAADTMFVIQVQHGCAMFAVVGHQLRRMGNETSKSYETYSRPADDPAFRHLAYCIKNHNHVIELSELLESTYTWAFFSIVGFNMLVISVTGFQIVISMNEKPEEALRYILFVIAQLIHLFFQSFFAQRLMDHSLQVRDYLCQAEWYKTSLYTQKLLNLVSMRSLVPCQLTAGKFLVMSLETFTMIVKTSMSYLTLLRSMQ